MKFELGASPPDDNSGVAVGDIYGSKQHKVTRYWAVIAIRDEICICLGLDNDGNITTGTNYGLHVFEGGCGWGGRKRLGRITNLDTAFNVIWESLP